jgi:hypothetical protein
MSGKNLTVCFVKWHKSDEWTSSPSPEILGLTWEPRKTSHGNRPLALFQIPHLKCIQMCEWTERLEAQWTPHVMRDPV